MMSSLVRRGSKSPLLPGARLLASMSASQLEEIGRRLEALESRVNEALQQGQAWPGKGSKQGLAEKPQQEQDKTSDTMADKAADVMEDAASDAVQRLHPALIKFLNRWACSWHAQPRHVSLVTLASAHGSKVLKQ